jgi:hypothetical protein
VFKYLITIGIWICGTSAALADQVAVTNGTDDTIYVLYAWPLDLSARTLNMLNTPLAPGASADVDVDNTYGDCQFMFETDPNNPADAKRRAYQRKDIKIRYVDLCRQNGKLDLLPDDDGM